MATDVRDPEAPALVEPAAAPGWWALLLPLVVIALWAVQRWSGTFPFGSDADEYRLVAEELRESGRPLVAGVEATKYPVGYPLVLAALDVVGLPVTRAALALNLGLLVALAATVLQLGRALGQRAAAVPATLFAVGGAGLWGSVYVTMPDLALVVIASVVLWWTGRLRTRRDVWVLVGLVVVATLLKSVGLLVALAASVAVLVAAPPLRRLAWAPAAASLVTTAVMALLSAPHPEHTTGYARTFRLEDPYDAAEGESSVLGLVQRLPGRAHLVLRDLESAVVGPQVERPWAWLLVVLLLGAGVWATWHVATRRAYVLAFLVVWLPAMAVWPYSSVRFQLPLLAIAAMGVGRLARSALGAHRQVGALIVVAAVSLFLWSSAGQVRRSAESEETRIGAIADDTAEAVAWSEANIPEGEVIASFAYREIAFRLDRPVVPLGYTSDLDVLLEEADAAGARWLIVMPALYGRRGALEKAFVDAFPERLRLAHETPTVQTYEVLPPAA